jgi:hypothetical protein
MRAMRAIGQAKQTKDSAGFLTFLAQNPVKYFFHFLLLFSDCHGLLRSYLKQA